MVEFIKKNILIILIFFVTLFVGFFTFLTFIDKSFIQLNDTNLQYLLLTNIILLLFFFFFLFSEINKSIKNDIDVDLFLETYDYEIERRYDHLKKVYFYISNVDNLFQELQKLRNDSRIIRADLEIYENLKTTR